ncbi:hypothetical protein B0H67DRAFT_254515 [Lasiosphaeris hirsuta]|uniref:MARVEL domain-containing protein n=1 Tax=Lasiosphaeris hirsuta TaxID=260670 RepID=A0AA40AHG1_9PEZI|nr:hypothetical protein B0H67DRAFT_254515 [Lasiosphaeris hirsuta]
MSRLLAKGVPPQPAWIIYIRYAILGLSLIIMALAAWSIAIFAGEVYIGYTAGAGGLIIFVTILSFIVYGGATALEMFAPHLFYRLAILIGYCFSVIFWLSGWAWAASTAGFWLAISFGYGAAQQEGAALGACAGLGAIVWILTIVNLVFFIKACISDRPGTNQAELGQVKHDSPAAYPQAQYPNAGPSPYPAQPAYPAQQPYATQ